MRIHVNVLSWLALLLLSFSPHPLRAQDREPAPIPHEHVISGSPLLLLAGWFNGEYERKLGEEFTVGIAGRWIDLDEEDYTGVDGFIRFYPQGKALAGYFFGGRAGIYNVDDGQDSHPALGIGLDVGFSWLLGPGRSFFLALGIGATRLIAGDLGDAGKVVPNLRLLDMGIAF